MTKPSLLHRIVVDGHFVRRCPVNRLTPAELLAYQTLCWDHVQWHAGWLADQPELCDQCDAALCPHREAKVPQDKLKQVYDFSRMTPKQQLCYLLEQMCAMKREELAHMQRVKAFVNERNLELGHGWAK